jgi:drug/metabolite transporter (DMT)-like permease
LSVQMLGGSSVALVVASTTTGFVHAPFTTGSLLAVTWLVLVASVVGFGAFATVLRGWPPSRAGSYAVINPIVSVLLGVLFAGEAVSWHMVAGAALTLCSVAWVQWCHR